MANFFKLLVYKFSDQMGAQLISLAVTIVLARVIDIEEFGAIELILIFISLCQIFVQNGLNVALVQKDEITDEEFSLALYLNGFVGAILYCLLFVSAPFIEDFYDFPNLALYIRVCGVILFPAAYTSIQNAFMARQYMFKYQMRCNIISIVVGGAFGILSAFRGLGVWSFIVYQIISYTLTPLLGRIVVKWKPGKVHNIRKIVPIFKHGIRVLMANFIDTLYNNVTSLIIGKKFDASSLALYSKGKQFPNALSTSVNGAIQTVSLPFLSRLQNDKSAMKESLRSFVQFGSFLVFPAMIGFMAISNELIVILLTDRWLDAVLFMQYMCIIYAAYPLYTANTQALIAIGRTDIYFRVELIRKILNLGVIVLSVFLFNSIRLLLLAQIIIIPCNIIICYAPNRKYLDYKIHEYVSDFIVPAVLSVLMFFTVNIVSVLHVNIFILLLLKIFVGGLSYLLLNIVCRNKNAKLFISMITNKHY